MSATNAASPAQMTAATQTRWGLVERTAAGELAFETRRRESIADRVHLLTALMVTAARYLGGVLPQVDRELAYWHARAAEIPDGGLRASALGSLTKRGNIEGAALFAVLAPSAERAGTVRALVAFQTAYNYLDGLSEEPSQDPAANADQLHQALLRALHPSAEHLDYYEYNKAREDDGYLRALVDVCREALSQLPGFPALAPLAREAAGRIVDFQALNLAERDGGHEGLRSWASETTPKDSGLQWWETAAAGGSSLAVHALIATAAHPSVDIYDAKESAGAYFPWGGALHSLLDALVDRREDERNGQRSLLDYYQSPSQATQSLRRLAFRATETAARLPRPVVHRVILTAMCSYYLSAPERDTREAREMTRKLTSVLGLPLHVAIWMFRIRRLKHTLTRNPYT